MKENRSIKVSVRLTELEKEELKAYCDRYELKMSEVLRDAMLEKIRRDR